VTWAAASGEPTTIAFDPVSTTRLKLDMTSRAPRTGSGFLAITELRAPPA
jgi:beta-galactosidase